MKDPYGECSGEDDCLCNKCVWHAASNVQTDRAKILNEQWLREVKKMTRTDNV